MNDTTNGIRDPYVTVGTNDDRQCKEGWQPPANRGTPPRPARTVSELARLELRAPENATYVGMDVWVPPSWRAPYTTWRLIARDREVGGAPEYGPYVDAGVRLEPGRWQTVELPLRVSPPAGSVVEVVLHPDPPGRPGRAAQISSWIRGASVSSAWLRTGDLYRPSDVTIVVLNWNRKAETIRCVESLRQANLAGATVLVVDNGSRDGSEEALRERFPDLWIIRLPQNRGYAGGNNAGIRAALEAGTKAVLLLNNDTRVAPDFLDPLLWVLNSDVKAAAVSSGVLRSDYQEVLESAYLEVYWGHGIILHYGVNALPSEGFNSRREVGVVVGCSWMLSSAALREIGLLDESYFAYHEEVDWCHRARQAGYRIYWQPYSRVWHTKSTSTAELAKPVAGERTRSIGPQLPASMPLPWNPIQTYLGARNAVRFIRAHANARQKLYFILSSLYGVPLEFLAAVMRQESALKIGAWNYRRALSMYCANPDEAGDLPAVPISTSSKILKLPGILFRALPRDIRIAASEGRLEQIRAHVRGLWDGLLNRPLPLEELGLR